jgi:glycosyltransferase involved in cell wall biosynthesis
VLYLDDLMALRFRHLARLADERPDAAWDPLGTFLPFVPKPLAPILRRRGVQRWLFRIEEERIGRRERAALADHDLALLINPGEAELLRHETGCAHVASIKPGLVMPEPPRPRRWDGAPEFLVLGSLRNAAHAASTALLLERELDALIRRIPGVRLRIVGGGATPGLLAFAARYPAHVRFEGFVADLDDALAGACALLAPLAFGGGLKLKVLTALAAGLPVIATRAGVDGIPVVPGADCLVEDDLERWPDALHSLLDPARNRAIGDAGRAAFAAHYARDVVFREYDALFGT